MKRENRYIVIKISDLEAVTSSGKVDNFTLSELDLILEEINNYRRDRGKEELKSVVVEHDWPEYEAVWAMLENRVDKKEIATEAEYNSGYKEAMASFNRSGFRLLRGISPYCNGWNAYMWSTTE